MHTMDQRNNIRNNIILQICSFAVLYIISPIFYKPLFNFTKNILDFPSSENFIKVDWEIFKIPEEQINKEKYLFSELDIKEKKSNNNDNNKNNHKIIIGIDFGTMDSGYSYSLDNDISNIKSNKKTPTEIILSKEIQNGLIISNSAHITMKNYNQKELSKILYIKAIKTIVNSKNETINNNLCYVYPNNIEINIKDALKSYFTLLKNDILKDLNYPKEEQILWVIAIPSNFDEFQKQLIYKSLKDSNMNNIKMINETEAASLSIFDDKYVENQYKKMKNTFLLISIGASSISFSANEIEDKYGTIKPKFSSVKNDIGSIFITEEIINIFINLVGKTKIDEIKSNNPGGWIKFLEEINKSIENTESTNGIEIFEITNIFEVTKNEEFKYGNNEYQIKFKNFIIELPSKLIGNILLNNISKIKEHLDDLMSKLKKDKINLNSFMITGGLSRNKIIKNEINKYAVEKEISAQYMSSYQYVISKGSVIYGLNPEKISPKESPITLGIYNFLKNKMEILIKKGDEIKNEINIVKYIKTHLETQDKIQIFVYLTEQKLNDDNELKDHLFGRLIIKTDKIDKKFENIKLTIKYDIYLKFSAIYYDTDKEIPPELTEFEIFNNNQIKRFNALLM